MSPAALVATDHSDIVPWPWQVWVFLIAVTGLVWLLLAILRPARTVREDSTPRRPARRPVPQHCRDHGHYFKADHEQNRWVCANPDCDESHAMFRAPVR